MKTQRLEHKSKKCVRKLFVLLPNPKLAFVGEVFSAEGEAISKPEYKAGLRWDRVSMRILLWRMEMDSMVKTERI